MSTPPSGWHCIVCGRWVERKTRIGTRCDEHRKHRQFDCGTCGKVFWSNRHVNSEHNFCSPPCSRRPNRRRVATVRRSGVPKAPRIRYRVVNLEWKQCICGRWVSKPGRKYCSPQCVAEVKRLDCVRRRRERGVPENCCRRCGVPVQHPLQFCPDHREAALRDAKRRCSARSKAKYGTTHRSRARRFGVRYEPVNKLRVFARDGWRCGICGEPVDKKLKGRHPMMASLDHIVPMALGGDHAYVNVQCAHLICNLRKTHRSAGDQLALIG